MDFGSLLTIAQKNSLAEQKSEKKCYVSKFTPPKKEKKDVKLSKNIQKFLAKREEEEREKERIARENRDRLLAMRDTKAKNKINKMLKVIKSANKSVLEDAVDHDNTAVTMQGPDQPDEDDYGYVSQEASQLYSKLMEKYKSLPDDEKKKDYKGKLLSKEEIRSTKDRVRAAIHREQEEENVPHKRQRHSKSSTDAGTSSSSYEKSNRYQPSPTPESKKSNESEKPKPKKRPPPPPAMDFQQLLKLAEQKQFEPIEIKTPKVEKEPERLMTQKEKREAEEKRAYFEAKERRQRERENPTQKSTNAPQKMEPNGKIPKLNGNNNPSANNKESNRIPKIQNNSGNSKLDLQKSKSGDKKPIPNSSSKLYGALTKPNQSSSSSVSTKPATSTPSSSSSSSKTIKSNQSVKSSEKQPVIKSKSMNNVKMDQPTGSSAKNIKNGKPIVNQSEIKSRPFPPSDVKSRPFPPADVKPRQFPPPDVRRSNKESQKKPMKRRVIESDSEYDSEMDDFIDDGPEEGQNYSKYISEIFGYDKKRYRDEDFDDREMESTFAQQMREEYISKKIGIMEDLEDMRQEALEKQKKVKRKK